MTTRNQGRLDFLDGQYWPSSLYGDEVKCVTGKLLRQDGSAIMDIASDQDVELVWTDFIEGVGKI